MRTRKFCWKGIVLDPSDVGLGVMKCGKVGQAKLDKLVR